MPFKIQKKRRENDYERVKLLFEYTKFHIGVYLSLASLLVAIFGLKKNYDIVFSSSLLMVSVGMITIAGLAGGIIVSRFTQVTTYNEFWFKRTGPWRLNIFVGECWTYIEHTAFWIGLIGAICAFFFPDFELWRTGSA